MASIQRREEGVWRARYRDEGGVSTHDISHARLMLVRGLTKRRPRSSAVSTWTPGPDE